MAAVEEAGSTKGQADRFGGVDVDLGDELRAGVRRVEAGGRGFEGVGRQEVCIVERTIDVARSEVDVLAQRVWR